MTHIRNLCLVRDVYRALEAFEQEFASRIGLSIREAFVICSLSEGALPANEISRLIGSLPSNTSKLLRSLEGRGYIQRQFGRKDRRLTFFSLTDKGHETFVSLKDQQDNCPPVLLPLIESGYLSNETSIDSTSSTGSL